jgi:ribosomal protein S27E
MESTEQQVHCPKCRSTQITASKKGFSGKNAVAGAILTGGIGLLAGTIGSNKVRITCLNCGHVFRPGEGAKEEAVKLPPVEMTEMEQRVIDNIKIVGRLGATAKYKEEMGVDIKEAKNAVDKIYEKFTGEKAEPDGTAASIGCFVVIVIAVIIYFMSRS